MKPARNMYETVRHAYPRMLAAGMALGMLGAWARGGGPPTPASEIHGAVLIKCGIRDIQTRSIAI